MVQLNLRNIMKLLIIFKITLLFLSLNHVVYATGKNETKILFFGDSHSVGPFGKNLDQMLRENKEHKVRTFASCGAIARWFVTGQRTKCGYYFVEENGATSKGTKGPTKKIIPVIENWKPEFVIVELSGNYSGYSDRFSIDDMKRMAKYIVESGAKCIWVGAPDARNRSRLPRLYDLLEKSILPYCHLVEGRRYTTYPSSGGDGIHYYGTEGRREAQNWARGVYEEFLQIKI